MIEFLTVFKWTYRVRYQFFLFINQFRLIFNDFLWELANVVGLHHFLDVVPFYGVLPGFIGIGWVLCGTHFIFETVPHTYSNRLSFRAIFKDFNMVLIS